MAGRKADSSLYDIPPAKALFAIDLFFREKYGLSAKEVLDFNDKKNTGIPLSAFSSSSLSCLEISVKYMKENLKLRYNEIAKILNRNERTVWCTYSNSIKKEKKQLNITVSEAVIPFAVVANRKTGALESIVSYLKDEKKRSFSDISLSLKKNYQTIYTSYRKAHIKKEGKK